MAEGAKVDELVAFAGSVGAIALGCGLLLDDYKDMGELGDERDPPVPHHYTYGLMLIVGGVAGACYSGLSFLKKLAEQ